MRKSTFLMAILLAAAAWGQTASPAFEVATVKMTDGPDFQAMRDGKGGVVIRMGMSVDGSRVAISSQTLADLICSAYRVKNYQVNGPDWITSQRYDIQAKIPQGVSKDLVPEMLQALLAERFQLTLRHETKDHNLYAMILGKDGLKLKEVEPDPPPAEGEGDGPGPHVMTNRMQGGGGGGMIASGRGGTTKSSVGGGVLHFDQKMTMPRLADFVGRFVDRPVVDMTEVKGTYQVVLDISIADLMRGGGNVQVRMMSDGVPIEGSEARKKLEKMADEQGGGTTVFAQLQKMGLKLDPRKAALENLIVEHAEKTPIEN